VTIDWNTILVAIIPATISGILAYLFGRREVNKKIDTSLIEDVQKITDIQKEILDNSEGYWSKRFEDHRKDCNDAKDNLRGDLAAALVEVADLKNKLAEKNGYIQGITNPLIKLEQAQSRELQSGRRATDINK
jgi:uncharacterized protein CbrC (UPF0167 family)